MTTIFREDSTLYSCARVSLARLSSACWTLLAPRFDVPRGSGVPPGPLPTSWPTAVPAATCPRQPGVSPPTSCWPCVVRSPPPLGASHASARHQVSNALHLGAHSLPSQAQS